MPIVGITLAYTAVAGLWGVVVTDLLQYILAMVGAVIVMGFALHEVGGRGALTAGLRASGQGARLDLIPRGEGALLPMGTLAGYVLVQWWAFRNSDGGGMFVQRLSATANEREAERATHAFNILSRDLARWLVWSAALLGVMLATGAWLLRSPGSAPAPW